MPRLEIELTAVELDDLRRLVNRLHDRNGKPLDLVRSRMIDKLRRAVTEAESRPTRGLKEERMTRARAAF